ncbi:hypothetical protein VMCG_08526 [Cytospora schulzeri]|uniref:Uncharacterized protein n=1 Tax=Cytospora schulzeri TaxID=448051 RepID=A0A423VWJ5_9PEZI|nr:hypothetical protein VMCG_08526 [Valsa malicola]
MVLLTSSQVSVALSSLIVISFTSALFLSGYVIQQRTVRNLRAAIKPNTSPQVYLPDEFRTDTAELADGTIVVLDEYNRPVRQKTGRPRGADGQALEHNNNNNIDHDAVVVEIKETLPEVDLDQQQDQRAMAIEQLQKETEEAENPESHEEGPPPVDVDADADAEPGPGPELKLKPQPAPWEVRAEGSRPGEEDRVENPDDEVKKPISRAERRRLIKEEISRLSQGEQPVYYQRRLW